MLIINIETENSQREYHIKDSDIIDKRVLFNSFSFPIRASNPYEILDLLIHLPKEIYNEIVEEYDVRFIDDENYSILVEYDEEF